MCREIVTEVNYLLKKHSNFFKKKLIPSIEKIEEESLKASVESPPRPATENFDTDELNSSSRRNNRSLSDSNFERFFAFASKLY
jgi:hypothetical protein